MRKPNGSQKAKALWKMKAARDSGEDFHDPERKDNFLGRNTTRLELWEEHPTDPHCGSGQSFEVRGESVSRLTIGSIPFVEFVFNGLWPRWKNLCGKEFGPTWFCGTVCVCAQHPRIGMSQRSMDRTVSSSFSC